MLKRIMEGIAVGIRPLGEDRSYPSQDDAQYAADIYNVLNSISTGGAGQEARKANEKLWAIYKEYFDYACGDKSPWKFDRKGKGGMWANVKVVYDKDKAENLGI
jgi:hypothetical protein